MKEVQAYRCEHCGKVYLMKTACLEHEAHRCPRNPETRLMCYDFKPMPLPKDGCSDFEVADEDDKKTDKLIFR